MIFSDLTMTCSLILGKAFTTSSTWTTVQWLQEQIQHSWDASHCLNVPASLQRRDHAANTAHKLGHWFAGWFVHYWETMKWATHHYGTAEKQHNSLLPQTEITTAFTPEAE